MKLNESLNCAIKEIRGKGLKKYKGTDKAISWTEKDFLNGDTVDAGVIILRTRGCRWGLNSGCSMCGYVYDSTREKVDENEVLTQFEDSLAGLDGIEYLKIFNSGSFFDPLELGDPVIESIFKKINKTGIKKVQVESRPEFLEAEILKRARDILEAQLEVGVGLESTNDEVRINCINKGFSLEDFETALDTCNRLGIEVKAYLLIKPPFLTEKEAIQDAINSGVEAHKLGVSRISYNPMNIQKGTLVDLLWRRGEYRAPWLWTVVEVLREVSKKVDIPVLSHPTAAGRKRGVHNCGGCDGELYKAIIDFSITQNPNHLKDLECVCKNEWEDYLDLESYKTAPF
ncbi:MAG: archaeosine biosynthesis radical SAM protein RaSEA [Candidatus Hydrothermarchaeales archaeon]